MNDFKKFAATLYSHFAVMTTCPTLCRTGADRDDLWERYLASFPEGSNPIYRVRTEHDGSYDRAFVKKLGNVVAIAEGRVVSIWDIPGLEYPYNIVAESMSKFVKSFVIVSAFRFNERRVGHEQTTERLEVGTKTWNHFYADVPDAYYTSDVATVLGDINTTVQVSARGFDEIDEQAVQTVLDLIDANALYRGTEFRGAVSAFQKLQRDYLNANSLRRNVLLWANQGNQAGRIRNTAIGTLLTDLSDGMALEKAVAVFEAKVAPTNYKRTTALVTPGMVKEAMKTIDELGLEDSVQRRFAKLSDLSVNDVLWVDGSVRNAMKEGGLGEMLKAAAVPKTNTGNATDIDIDDFMDDVLPKATGVEVLFKNTLQPHLMSLTAPVHADAPSLFKWGNNFGWSYNGNITDSIKERVKNAGGNINAKLRVSLAWFNKDDLDLHAYCPEGHVYFGEKCGDDYTVRQRVQILDVDQNAPGTNLTRMPVENLAWANPKDGTYQIRVHQYSRRETADVGFSLEFEYDGKVQQFSYDKAVAAGLIVNSIGFKLRGGELYDFKINDKGLTPEGMSQVVWGVETEKFVKVNTVLKSPNYWEHSTGIGNKHWFFIVDKCKNEEATRGIYNEFLKNEFDKHRKVFELIGDKTKCPPTDDQLSGLGFSSTKHDCVTVRVTGPKINQLYTINF